MEPVRTTSRRRRGPASSGRSARKAWSITAVGALAAAAHLGPAPVCALDVQPPPEWIQCRPATVNFQSQGNVSVIIRTPKDNSRKMETHSISRVGVGQTSWTWPAVDLLAGTEFVLSIHDDQPWHSTTRSNKDVADLGHFLASQKVTLPADYANDTSCIPPEKPKSSKKKQRGRTEVAVIAGVLAGVLLALLGLLGVVVWRRRREAKLAGEREAWLDHESATAAGGDGTSTNQANDGSAGWKYMSRLVPGLSPADPGAHVPGVPNRAEGAAVGPAFLQGAGRRGRRARRNRTERIQEFDAELPSYGHSQSDAKMLPKYANGVGPGPMEEYDLPTVAHRQGDVSIDAVDERQFQQYHEHWDQGGAVTRAAYPASQQPTNGFSPPTFADPRARPHPHDVFADPLQPLPPSIDVDSSMRPSQRMPYETWSETGAGMGLAESQVNLVGIHDGHQHQQHQEQQQTQMPPVRGGSGDLRLGSGYSGR